MLHLKITPPPVTTVTTRRKPFVTNLVFYTAVAAYVLVVGQDWAIYAAAAAITIWIRSPNDFKNRLW